MSRDVRLQTTIPHSNIVIDHWDVRPSRGRNASIRFMTSIKNHSVTTVTQMRKADYLIYTSLFNKWYLHEFFQVSEDRVVVLEYNDTTEILDPDGNEKFHVTAISANYCAGSCMFLFQGSFGNVLYTGYFRPFSSIDVLRSCPALNEVVEQNKLHVAYVDNSYAAENCNFARRGEMIKHVAELIRSGSNCKIYISSSSWGKEEWLVAIASELDEEIAVGAQKYSIFEKLGVSHMFTRQSRETRIRLLDNLLSLKECEKMLKRDKTCIIILMTAVYKYGPKKFPSLSKYPRLYIIPYSGHCNHNELKEFVRTIRPHAVLPVVRPRREQKCSTIPKSILDLCGKVDEPSGVCEQDRDTFIVKSNPTVLIPKLQVSPLRLKRINGSYCPTSTITPQKNPPTETRVCECVTDVTRKDSEVPAEAGNSRPYTRSSAAEKEQNDGKSINVSIIRRVKVVDSSHASVPTSTRLASSNISADEEGQSSSTENPHPIEVNVSVIECVQPLSPEGPSDRPADKESCVTHPADRNESPVIFSPNHPEVSEELNLNDVVTPPRHTQSPEPLDQSDTDADMPEFSSPSKLDAVERADLSEAVTPPLREIERRSQGKRRDMSKMPELDDLNGTNADPANCPHEESGNMLDSHANQVLADIIDEMPLSMRLQNANVSLDSHCANQPEDNGVDEMSLSQRLRNIDESLDSHRANQTKDDVVDEMALSVRMESDSASLNSCENQTNDDVDELPLTLRLQNVDIRSIREDCRNVLLGSSFPHIFQKEEPAEEAPKASRANDSAFCSSDYVIEEYVIEETIAGSRTASPSNETDLPPKHSNDKAPDADSAESRVEVSSEVVDTHETASVEAVSEAAIKSISSEAPHNSSPVQPPIEQPPNLSPVRTELSPSPARISSEIPPNLSPTRISSERPPSLSPARISSELPPESSPVRTEQPHNSPPQRTEQPHNSSPQRTEQPHNSSPQRTEQPHNSSPQRTEQPHNSSPQRTELPANSSPVRTPAGILSPAIASESPHNRVFSPTEDVISVSVTVDPNPTNSSVGRVREKRPRSEDDAFELDEEVSARIIDSDPASQNPVLADGGSRCENVEQDSCVLVETRSPVANSSHSVAPAADDLGGSDQSDSDDCMVVCEYMRGAETPAREPFARATKRLRLDTICRPRRNDQFVNAIFFHYMKSRPQEMSKLPFDAYKCVSGINIFSHPAYKRQ